MSIIVISVGTSLISNNCEISGDINKRGCETLNGFFENATIDQIKGVEFEADGRLRGAGNPLGFEDFSSFFFKSYLDPDTIKANIQYRENGQDMLPAEISSLYLYYYDKAGNLKDEFHARLREGSETGFNEKDKVILLTTQTVDALLCAKMIRVIIENVALFNEKCEFDDAASNHGITVIEGLDVYEPENWINGLSALKRFCNLVYNQNQNTDRIILRTGGYKEFSADLKLLAMRFSFKSYYLFEKSDRLLRFYNPGWPVNFDVLTPDHSRIV